MGIDSGDGHRDTLVFERDGLRSGGRLIDTGRRAASGEFSPPPPEKPTPKRVAVWKVVCPGDVILTTDQDGVDRLSKAIPGEFKGDKGHFGSGSSARRGRTSSTGPAGARTYSPGAGFTIAQPLCRLFDGP